jgi:hypothetical protein
MQLQSRTRSVWRDGKIKAAVWALTTLLASVVKFGSYKFGDGLELEAFLSELHSCN